MIEYIKVALLAVAQGIAEFLPVSSSGHLLVLGSWFGFEGEENLKLNVLLHAGTLLAIFIYYFTRLWSILIEPARRRLIALVIVGSIPAGVVGVGLKTLGWEEQLFSSPWAAVTGFVITGTMLLTVFRRPIGNEDGIAAEKMSFKQALLIGCAQAIAIAPGISRSGSTISAAVKLNLRKADAAEFSFLLAIPAIGGAALLETLKLIKDHDPEMAITTTDWLLPLTGFVIAAAVGYLSLVWLIKLLNKGRFAVFAYYLYAAALAAAGVEITKFF